MHNACNYFVNQEKLFERQMDSLEEMVTGRPVQNDSPHDIKGSKKIEAHEAALNDMADAMPQLVWIAEPNGDVTYYNNRISEFMGATKDDSGNWHWQGLVHPDDSARTASAWKEAVATGSIYQTEHRVQMKDGLYRWFLSRAVPHKDKHGRITKWFGTATDIHDTKLSEEKIRTSEAYFRQLTDTVPAIIWITEPDGSCSYLNKHWYTFTGQTHEEAEGFGWLDATHPDDKEQAGKIFVEANANQKPFSIIYRLRNSEGDYRWAIDSGSPRFSADGIFEGMIGTVVDVHERKLAENAIRQSEAHFRTLAETLPQLVWMTNEKGEQEYASSRWQVYTGIQPSGAETWSQIVHPHDMPSITEAWTTSMQTGSVYRSEARLKNKDGHYRWHFAHAEPIINENGEVVKWIGAFTDIHDQKTLSEKLEKLVAARTKELQQSNDDLQQFAHVASHDLKEPVRKVTMFASRLEEEFGHTLDERAKIYISKIQKAANRMFTMIEGVLTYSTINAYTQMPEKVDLNEMVATIEQDLELVIQEKGAVVEHDVLPVLEAAPVLLYQLLYNLINNSLKFSKPGVPPRIWIDSEIKMKDDTEFVELRVKDNGIGFEAHESAIIFDTFTRLNSKATYDGTGLGLSLCKKIAERHGGEINATGDSGLGATFTVTLPLKQQQKGI